MGAITQRTYDGGIMPGAYRLRDPMIPIYLVSGAALFVLLAALVVVLLTIPPI